MRAHVILITLELQQTATDLMVGLEKGRLLAPPAALLLSLLVLACACIDCIRAAAYVIERTIARGGTRHRSHRDRDQVAYRGAGRGMAELLALSLVVISATFRTPNVFLG